MAASTDNEFTLTGAGDPQFLIGYRFSAGYFPLQGVEPQLGRTFRPEEDWPGAPDVVVLSDRLWRRTFHADRHIVGRPSALDGKPYTAPRFETVFLEGHLAGVPLSQAEGSLNCKIGFRHSRGIGLAESPY